jgi:hypothetical protein
MLVQVDVLRHSDASFSQSMPLRKISNRHGFLQRLRSRLRLRLRLRFLKVAWLLNSTEVERELLVMGVQRLGTHIQHCQYEFEPLGFVYLVWAQTKEVWNGVSWYAFIPASCWFESR